MAAGKVTSVILELAGRCIGKRAMKEIKSTHPWLTPEIVRLTEEKRKAEGTEQEKEAIETCSAKISETRKIDFSN